MAILWCCMDCGVSRLSLLIDISASLNQSVHLNHMAIRWCPVEGVERVPEEECPFNKFSYTFKIHLHIVASYLWLIGAAIFLCHCVIAKTKYQLYSCSGHSSFYFCNWTIGSEIAGRFSQSKGLFSSVQFKKFLNPSSKSNDISYLDQG